jgi:hypothetical protein
MVSVISPKWQFIAHEFNGVELYSLADDPNQEDNLAGENPAALDELKNYYLDLLSKLGMTWPYDNK